ncbi:hypothetical protein M885DRAFT_618545 [Pelagophyceae sp. CCMP2097]|nr:hypothetical protein M885DRAFT_618545 [Pelagophyceae sp. CCMP2097]
MPLYGAVVIGPPGAGKSTLCAGLVSYMALMKRPCALVNLDPAAEGTGCGEAQVPFDIDVRDLTKVDDVMRSEKLGPNGALLHCVSTLRAHAEDWLVAQIQRFGDNGVFPYFIVDLPGQVEVFTNGEDFRDILGILKRVVDARLVAVHVVDSVHCARPSSFVAAALLSLTAMLRLELPHVNVLSKMDLIGSYKDDMPFPTEYFCEAQQLHRLAPFAAPGSLRRQADDYDYDDDDDAQRREAPASATQIERLTHRLCEIIDDFSLVCYQPLDISDGKSVANLIHMLDKATGHPAGAHDPVSLLDDPTKLFLARDFEQPPEDITDAEARADAEAQQAAVEAENAAPPDAPPAQLPFSWYAFDADGDDGAE